jgi:prepilin-type N-terminal cleavage/methylation domain-containing protein
MVTTLKKKTNKKGFTLVELVMVIAIIAILAAIAVPTVSNVITTANKNVDAANAQTVELALKSAYAEACANTWQLSNDGKPNTDDELAKITVTTALTHEGIATIPDSKSGATWTYQNGKVYCDSSHITTGTNPATALSAGLYVEDVIKP